MRQSLIYSVAVAVASSFLGTSNASGQAAPAVRYVRGGDLYVNREYGVQLRVPTGKRGLHNAPPTPQHGIKIPLSAEDAAFIWLDASYDVTDLGQPTAACEHFIATTDATLDSKVTSGHLAGRTGCRVILRNRDRTGVERHVEALIIMRHDGQRSTIVYTLGVQTTPQRKQQDLRLLNTVTETVALLPLDRRN